MKPRTRLFPFFLARALVALAFFAPAPAARASTGFMSFATLNADGTATLVLPPPAPDAQFYRVEAPQPDPPLRPLSPSPLSPL